MSREYLVKFQTNLPVDIYFEFEEEYRYGILAFCSKSDSLNGISAFNFQDESSITLMRALEVSNTEFNLIKNWLVYNGDLISALESKYLALSDFEKLMFKCGEVPSENQIRTQKRCVDMFKELWKDTY